MLDASRSKPRLVAQLVPSPATFAVDNLVMGLVHGDHLGDLLAVSLRTLPYGFQPPAGFVNYEAPMHWRRDQEISGLNVPNLGIWYESLQHWIGPATRVRLFAADCRETALARSSLGTELAARAKLAGPENANDIPITTATPSIRPRTSTNCAPCWPETPSAAT